jgi:hypothetical protein
MTPKAWYESAKLAIEREIAQRHDRRLAGKVPVWTAEDERNLRARALRRLYDEPASIEEAV